MAISGLRISSNNNDALAQIDRDTVYSSKFSTLKILKKGYISITTNGSGTGTKRIQHGLGYCPTFYVWRKDTASFGFLDGTSYPGSFHPMPGTPTPWVQFHLNTLVFSNPSQLVIGISGATPSTTYHFLYYIFVDQGEFNQAAGAPTNQDYGVKVTKQGDDAETAKEQRVAISSEYNTLKYYKELITNDSQMSLPQIAGDFFDTNPQEGTYVDFMHNLGYPPFFLAYAETEFGIISLPDATIQKFGDSDYALTAWCNHERIRVTFYRKANYGGGFGDVSWDTSGPIKVKVFIFTENLELQ